MILARLAHLVHQVLPVYSERLSLEHLAHRDHQDLLGCQEKMDTRFVCQKEGLCVFPSPSFEEHRRFFK